MNADNRETQFRDSEIYRTGKRSLLSIIFGRTAIIILLLALQFAGIFAMFVHFERYIEIAYGGLAVVSAVMAVYVANTKDNPAIKLSWTALILVAPVFGSLLYLFVHKEIGHRIMRRRLEKILEETKNYCVLNAELQQKVKSSHRELYNVSTYTYGNGKYPLYENCGAKYYPTGESAWESILCELEKAKEFIFLEYFIIEDGEMWGKILDILRRKASEGVEVRVMYDGTCSVALLPYNYPRKLSEMGIKCRIFSPLRPFVSTHYNNRDHRKILVIDGKTAFTGGINFADEYINKKVRFGHWKDCAIKLQGKAVKSFTLMFLQMWNIAGGKENYAYYLSRSEQSSAENVDGYIIPYGDSPLDDEKVGETVYMDIINTAKEYVHIMTPYLIIDNEMTTALANAAKRGVDVKIIVPHIPDHISAYAVAKTHYSELVPDGVKIYEYTPGFIHSKVFVSDSVKAVVGTINLDYRSLYLHFECAAYLYGASAVADIEEDFGSTLEKCREIALSDIRKRGLLTHLKNGLLKLVAPLM